MANLLRQILYAWAALVLSSLVHNLESSFQPTLALHRERVHAAEDCRQIAFSQRYPSQCAMITLSPPRWFINEWVGGALSQVSLCGPTSCAEAFSFRGILVTLTVGFLIRAPAFAIKLRNYL